MNYRVEWGWCGEEFETFPTFGDALAFYRGYTAARNKYQARLTKPDNIDGAEDASAAAQHGLTRSEWEQVEAVG